MISWRFLIVKGDIHTNVSVWVTTQISKIKSKRPHLLICLKSQNERDVADHGELFWDTVIEVLDEFVTVCHNLTELGLDVSEFSFVLLEDAGGLLGSQPTIKTSWWLIPFFMTIQIQLI